MHLVLGDVPISREAYVVTSSLISNLPTQSFEHFHRGGFVRVYIGMSVHVCYKHLVLYNSKNKLSPTLVV